MLRLNSGATQTLIMLLANGVQAISVQGQTWHWSSDLPYEASHAMDCVEEADGRIHVAVGAKVLVTGVHFARGHVFDLGADGSQTGVAAITFPDAGVVPYGFVLDGSNGEFCVFSNVTDSLLWTGPEGATIGITRLGTDLELISASETPTGYSSTGQLVLALPNDQVQVVITGSQYGSFDQSTIVLMRLDLQGNLLDNEVITDCVFCAANSLVGEPGGGLLMGTFMTGLSNSYSGSDVLYLDSAGSVLATYGTPSVDDTLETFHTIISSFTARRLPNGRLMLAGATQPQETYRGVVQLTDSTVSEVYGQFFPPHDYVIDNPAVHRCLDMNADNEIFFAQTENLNFGITQPEPGWPSAVHLYRFDTDLNVTGSYLIDGFADSSYYFLRSVRATADGGALLTGSVADVHMNATDLRTRAWVAKVSADDLLLDISEHDPRTGWLFPNPGTEGFRLELSRPLRNGSLRIMDPTGRVVQFKRLDGIRAEADARAWAAGCYHVLVSDDSGLPVFGTTWIKQ